MARSPRFLVYVLVKAGPRTSPRGRSRRRLINESFARSVGWNVGAVAYHQRRCHVDARERRRPIVRKADYDLYGLLSHLRDRNADGGKSWSGPPRYLQVVVPDDGQFRGDGDPEG